MDAAPEPAALLALVQSIPVQLQMAREYAILGNYDVAMNFFDVALGSIGRFIRSMTSSDDRRQWFTLKEQVQAEVKLVKSLQATLVVFRQPPGSGAAASGAASADDDEGRWPAPEPLPPSTYATRQAGAGAAGAKRSGVAVPGSGPPAWSAAIPSSGAAAGALGRAAPSRAAVISSSGAPAPRGRVTAVPAAAAPAAPAAASSGRGPGGGGASGKPPVPRQPAGGAGRGVARAGAPGGSAAAPTAGGGGGTGRPKYSELHHLAADTELIAMVENDSEEEKERSPKKGGEGRPLLLCTAAPRCSAGPIPERVLRLHRWPRGGQGAHQRGGRAAHADSGLLPGHPAPVEGGAALWAARHGEDAPGQGRRHRVQDHIL